MGADHEGTCLAEVGSSTVLDCVHCGFAHVMPLPTESEAVAFHEEEFFDELKPAYRESHDRDRAWWDLVHDRRLARLERQLGRTGRLLDVGSGFGDLIARANLCGWSAEGIEPSRRAALWANQNGRKTLQAAVSAENLQALGTFDAIIFDQSIEHILNPRGAILDASALLAEDGVLCVNFANDFSPIQVTAATQSGHPPWWIVPDEHINYFDANSMKRLLTSVSMVCVDMIASFPIDSFLLMGFDYVAENALGREMHMRRIALEFAFRDAGAMDRLEEAYRGLALAGFGREIEITARRLPNQLVAT